MGQYKVPQDVEAEDKIIGPLTIRQFIYAVIGVAWAGLIFVIFKKIPFLVVLFGLPPTFLFLLLAFYKRDGQDFEHYLVALVGYFGQSRRRLWRKDPVAEAFKLVPPKVTSNVTQRDAAEVRSQLEQLAGVMDTRGGLNALEQPAGVDDRLFTPEQPTAAEQPLAAEANQQVDILDPQQNPGAAVVTDLIDQTAQEHRQEVVSQVQAQVAQPAPAATPTPTTSTMTAPVSDAIIQLAQNNPDLPIAQIASQAHRITPLSEGETVTITNGQNTPAHQ